MWDKIKALMLQFTGTDKPLTSLTWVAAILASGALPAIAGVFGFDFDAHTLTALLDPGLTPGERVMVILGLFGIRRRLS